MFVVCTSRKNSVIMLLFTVIDSLFVNLLRLILGWSKRLFLSWTARVYLLKWLMNFSNIDILRLLKLCTCATTRLGIITAWGFDKENDLIKVNRIVCIIWGSFKVFLHSKGTLSILTHVMQIFHIKLFAECGTYSDSSHWAVWLGSALFAFGLLFLPKSFEFWFYGIGK